MKLEESQSAVVIQPAAVARASVIWLHGLGADGYDFVPIVRELELPDDLGARFIFPHAPVRPVTLNNGMPMRAWYDIASLDRKGLLDETGIRQSETTVRGLIAAERKAGVAADRIVIAGFSQGGAIAQHTALRFEERLAGLLPLSTYLPLADALATEGTTVNKDLPILMCHGQHDPILPLTLGEWSRDQLRALGYTVDWQVYPMAHEVCAPEIERIGRWLTRLLAA